MYFGRSNDFPDKKPMYAFRQLKQSHTMNNSEANEYKYSVIENEGLETALVIVK